MAAEEVPSTPAASGKDSDMSGHRPVTPQQAAVGVTPISKAIALLQHRSSATPTATPNRTARTAELSARKAELATLLNQVHSLHSSPGQVGTAQSSRKHCCMFVQISASISSMQNMGLRSGWSGSPCDAMLQTHSGPKMPIFQFLVSGTLN